MNKEVLSDTEAAKLFNSVASNMGDPTKLEELLGSTPDVPEPETTPAEAVKEESVNTEEVSQVEQVTTDDASKEAPTTAGVPDYAEELKSLRQRYEQLEHRHRSDEGRVAAFQRKSRELEDKLAALEQASKATPVAVPAPSALDASEVEAAAALEDLKRVDPALYKILVARDTAYKKELEALKTAVSTELAPVRQTITTYERDQEKTRLREMVPNIAEVVVSEEFQAYKESAPQIVKQWLKSTSADDVVEGMKAYALHLQMTGKVPVALSNTQEAVTAATTPATTPVTSERERKLATSVNVGTSPSTPVRKELSEEELFKEIYAQLHNARNKS